LKRPYISKALKLRIARQASNRCGYCQAPQHLLIVRLEIEHIIPLSLGGTSHEDNLWLCCSTCNMYKGSKIAAIDPVSHQQVPLYNPRFQKWSIHFKWSQDGTEIIGITDIGRTTIEALKLNNELSVAARRFWVLLGEFPPA
jgi:5-methylcytosine-specific restriction endonuclease McrA